MGQQSDFPGEGDKVAQEPREACLPLQTWARPFSEPVWEGWLTLFYRWVNGSFQLQVPPTSTGQSLQEVRETGRGTLESKAVPLCMSVRLPAWISLLYHAQRQPGPKGTTYSLNKTEKGQVARSEPCRGRSTLPPWHPTICLQRR